MRDICFIDKSFESSQSNHFHLSLQISQDGLFYTILDIEKGKYVVLSGTYLFVKRPRLLLKQVKEIIEKEEFLRLEYQSIEILYATKVFTLIPAVFYSGDGNERFLYFNHPEQRGFLFRESFFSKAETWCLFTIPENLNEYLKFIFPKATIRHNLFPLIENAVSDKLNYPSRQQVHLNFLRDCFEMVVVKGPKLLQSNIFDYKNERDILYFVLFVFDQLKLSPEDTEVIIHGQIPQVSPAYHLLKKYIRQTSFSKPDSTYQQSYTFSQMPEHYFTSLLNLYKCV